MRKVILLATACSLFFGAAFLSFCASPSTTAVAATDEVLYLGWGGDPWPHFTRALPKYKRYTYATVKYGLYAVGGEDHPRVDVRVRVRRNGQLIRQWWVVGWANRDVANHFRFKCRWKPGWYRLKMKGFHDDLSTTTYSLVFIITKP